MEMFQWFVFAAIAAVLVSLGAGIFAMVNDGHVGHYDSTGWMKWRVGFQAVAAVLVLAAVYGEA